LSSSSEAITVVVPPQVAKKLKAKAEEKGVTVTDLVIMAIVKVLEET